MIYEILDTKSKIKIARLFSSTKGSFQVSDVARKLDISKSRASECLKDLAEDGLLESKIVGRSLIYQLKPNGLSRSISKSLNVEENLLKDIERRVVKELKPFKPTSIALFGSAIKELKSGSDIDFIIVYKNDFNRQRIYEISSRLSESFGFTVSLLLIQEKELIEKAKRGEEFMVNILATNKLLHGKQLEEIVWPEKSGKKKQ